jgi:hypothetical protein
MQKEKRKANVHVFSDVEVVHKGLPLNTGVIAHIKPLIL